MKSLKEKIMDAEELGTREIGIVARETMSTNLGVLSDLEEVLFDRAMYWWVNGEDDYSAYYLYLIDTVDLYIHEHLESNEVNVMMRKAAECERRAWNLWN